MARHSSFGSRLGAYRNRQIRRELRFGWKDKSNTVTPIPTESDEMWANILAGVFVFIVIVGLLSLMAL
jgi:hypothetical protein